MRIASKKTRASGKVNRAHHKRGPQVAMPTRRAREAKALESNSDRAQPRAVLQTHLLNHRKHFTKGSANADYFRATRAIVTTARRWRKLANERVGSIGQTMARWETLFLVAFSEAGLTQGELARLISVEGPTTVRMLDLLAKKGLIVRRQNAADRRITSNRITAKGMREIGNIMAITDQLRRDILGKIDPTRLTVCIDVLEEILSSLGALTKEK